MFNYTKGKFSPVQFLGSWLFMIRPLSAIVNPLFLVVSGGSFFNPSKYWTFAMSAVKKLGVAILRNAAMSAGQRRKACPFLGSLGSPSTMGWGEYAVKCSRGSETWSTSFLISKETIRCFLNSLPPKSQRYFLAFSKLETSFLKSGLIASPSSFCLALCLPSFRAGPALVCPNKHSKMISGSQAWISTIKMNRREWLSWNLQTETGNQAPILMRLYFQGGLWNHNC